MPLLATNLLIQTLGSPWTVSWGSPLHDNSTQAFYFTISLNPHLYEPTAAPSVKSHDQFSVLIFLCSAPVFNIIAHFSLLDIFFSLGFRTLYYFELSSIFLLSLLDWIPLCTFKGFENDGVLQSSVVGSLELTEVIGVTKTRRN